MSGSIMQLKQFPIVLPLPRCALGLRATGWLYVMAGTVSPCEPKREMQPKKREAAEQWSFFKKIWSFSTVFLQRFSTVSLSFCPFLQGDL